MTCIVGVRTKDGVVMGGDSAAVSGLSRSCRKDPKVFRRGDFIMGFTVSFRYGQILQYEFDPPELPTNCKSGKALHKFMVTQFIPELRETLRQHGWLKIQDGIEENGYLIVGIRNFLFEVDTDFQVGWPAESFAACGCGEDYALGALAILDNVEIEAEEKVKLALAAAARFSAGVMPPYKIIKSEIK